MRDIKFRVWDKSKKYFIYFGYQKDRYWYPWTAYTNGSYLNDL